jgi:multiple sugar transport system permease protein
MSRATSPNGRTRRRPRLPAGRRLATHLILALGAVAMIGPFVWSILTSFKTLGEAFQVPPTILPEQLRWENYAQVFTQLPFLAFYENTIIVTAVKVVGVLITSSLAGYAFARIDFPGRNVLFALYLAVLMVPYQIFLLPQFLIMAKLGWVNTLLALIVPGLFDAFGTFLLRQFFMGLPRELEDAAKIDGCNHFQIYRRIMLPLAKPGLIALAIFTFLWSWNDFLWPLVVINSPEKMPLGAGLAFLQGQYLTDFPLLMAGAMLSTLPVIAVFVVLQRQFVEGVASTGIKG